MTNRLIKEKSPYLLQHAGNPVDWYPWGDEALSRAQREDKPILLSIGYSACHWCHVMAHESFENSEIALLMNENFINIKVDREERPDLDTVYMEAVQLLTGSGGWPLTVFLTPDGKPFYGGTYFPPEDGRGMPGFPGILKAVSQAYRNRRQEVDLATSRIIKEIKSGSQNFSLEKELLPRILHQAYTALSYSFDRVNGGLGQAPKFPQPVTLEFLLRYYDRFQNKDALQTVVLTLEKMAKGGIYDQLGGGFHRYSTDDYWLVPHFEKMLYDNAQLIQLYLQAFLITHKPFFKRIAEATVDYVLREMTDPQGGFYSSEDADSEGKEGKYYLWTVEEIRNILLDKADGILEYYGLVEHENFESGNILHITTDNSADDIGLFEEGKRRLLKEREKRIHPGRDQKILASWNGLMLTSLSEAACILDRKDYLDAAVANAEFLFNNLLFEGNLKHVHSNGQSRIEGFLEDYANILNGFLSLHQATLKGRWLSEAINLAEVIVRDFWDEAEGHFYDTGKQHESLFLRPQSVHDGALPSGASAAAQALLKISRITHNNQFEQIARKSLKALTESMSAYPGSFSNWLNTLDMYLSTSLEIAIIGPSNGHSTHELTRVLYEIRLPNKVVVGMDPNDPTAQANLSLFENKEMINDQAAIYVCKNFSCRKPVTNPEELKNLLLKPEYDH